MYEGNESSSGKCWCKTKTKWSGVGLWQQVSYQITVLLTQNARKLQRAVDELYGVSLRSKLMVNVAKGKVLVFDMMEGSIACLQYVLQGECAGSKI